MMLALDSVRSVQTRSGTSEQSDVRVLAGVVGVGNLSLNIEVGGRWGLICFGRWHRRNMRCIAMLANTAARSFCVINSD